MASIIAVPDTLHLWDLLPQFLQFQTDKDWYLLCVVNFFGGVGAVLDFSLPPPFFFGNFLVFKFSDN